MLNDLKITCKTFSKAPRDYLIDLRIETSFVQIQLVMFRHPDIRGKLGIRNLRHGYSAYEAEYYDPTSIKEAKVQIIKILTNSC